MYYTLIRILIIIKKYLNDWEPTDVFHDGHLSYSKYDKPDISLFGTSYGEFHDKFTYTKLGKWFDNAPIIVSIVKILYYIPTWIVWCITNMFWLIIILFLPKNIINSL